MKTLLRVRCRPLLPPGTVVDPLAADQFLTIKTDEMAQRTWCYWRRAASAVGTGQALYCYPNAVGYNDDDTLHRFEGGPEFFDIRRVACEDERGQVIVLEQATDAFLDAYAAGWRKSPEVGRPAVWVARYPKIELYPVPSYTRAGALVVEGYARPSSSWSQDGDNFPLPAAAMLPVIAGSAAYLTGSAALATEFEAGVNLLWRQSIGQHEQGRAHAPTVLGGAS